MIEKIDVGGPSMIRAAAKNHKDVVVIAAKSEYAWLVKLLEEQNGETTLEQRRQMAARAFEICARYDVGNHAVFQSDRSRLFPQVRRCRNRCDMVKSAPGCQLLWPADRYF